MEQDSAGRQQLLRKAEPLLQSALDLLDRGAAPAHIGAYVDLALNQLRSILDSEAQEGSVPPMQHRAGGL